MTNEFLLILSIFVLYIGVLFAYTIWGKVGLFCFSVFATIIANIEVLILVDAFGMEQTLGNVLFATTFIITDILSENEGKIEAKKAVFLSISASLLMIIVTQMWMLYTPSPNDWAFSSIHTIFYNTPRLLFSSLLVFAIVQNFDVWLYHKIWSFTKQSHTKKKFLWLRNNISTMISQLLNAMLYTILAFGGMYETSTLISIIISSYIIFVITALIDTPIVYIARKIHDGQAKHH